MSKKWHINKRTKEVEVCESQLGICNISLHGEHYSTEEEAQTMQKIINEIDKQKGQRENVDELLDDNSEDIKKFQ